jgi:hypothetical protein
MDSTTIFLSPITKTHIQIQIASMTLDDWLDATELGCFKFLETAINLNWLEAQQKCQEIGGYLAEPRTFRYVQFACEHTALVQEIKDRWHSKVNSYK